MDVKLKALVIDDSSVMRKMVMKSLTDSRLAVFEFVEAEDGLVGLERMVENEFDIVFVDWNMPTMTGIDFVKEVRRRELEDGRDPLPLVMVTSEKSMGKMQTALDQAGADHFISKPFTVDELKQKLQKLVDTALAKRIEKEQAKASEEEAEESGASGGFFSKLFG